MRNTRQRSAGHRQQAPASLASDLLNQINFKEPSAELFDTTAEEIAKQLSNVGREMNRSTQLRRFYDEICTWDAQIKQNPEKFASYLPLIRMLNAKAAYAQGRRLVDGQFASLMSNCLPKVTCLQTFANFKLFFEAFLGFYRLHKGD